MITVNESHKLVKCPRCCRLHGRTSKPDIIDTNNPSWTCQLCHGVYFIPSYVAAAYNLLIAGSPNPVGFERRRDVQDTIDQIKEDLAWEPPTQTIGK